MKVNDPLVLPVYHRFVVAAGTVFPAAQFAGAFCSIVRFEEVKTEPEKLEPNVDVYPKYVSDDPETATDVLEKMISFEPAAVKLPL